MIVRSVLATLLLVSFVSSGGAQTMEQPLRATPEERARVEPLLMAAGMPALLEIMREEGLEHAEILRTDMFPTRAETQWPEMIDAIYDTDRMGAIMLDELAADLKPWYIDPLQDFFDTERGREIVALEVGARQAMMDPAVEAASTEMLEQMRAAGSERLTLLEDFATVNDLVEMNVAGALNANFAFRSGLLAGGSLNDVAGEEDLLRDVWAQEDEIRQDTAIWLFSYLALAYQPLEQADIEAYIELSQSEAGQAFNTYLFGAFDELFQTVSYDLGLAAARFLTGEDL